MESFTLVQLQALVSLYQFVEPQDKSIEYQIKVSHPRVVLPQIDDIDNPKVDYMPRESYHLFAELINQAFDKLVKEIGIKDMLLNELKTAIKEASTQEETLQQAVRDILEIPNPTTPSLP